MAKVSKTKMDAIIKSKKPETKEISIVISDEKTVVVEVNPNISFENFSLAVQELANLQFSIDEENKAATYVASVAPFAEWYTKLKYFTNVDVAPNAADGQLDEKEVERIWNLRFCDEFERKVTEIIGDVWYEIQYAADEESKNRLPGYHKFWNDVEDMLDEIKQQFHNAKPEDLETLLTGIGKLNSIDDGKIIQFMKDVKTGKAD